MTKVCMKTFFPGRHIGRVKSASLACEAVRPRHSNRLYLRIAPCAIAFLKFILEGYDNLAYLSVVDKDKAFIKLVYAPMCKKEIDFFLKSMQPETGFSIVYRVE